MRLARSTTFPAVDLRGTEGRRVPGRWSLAPSSTGIGRPSGNSYRLSSLAIDCIPFSALLRNISVYTLLIPGLYVNLASYLPLFDLDYRVLVHALSVRCHIDAKGGTLPTQNLVREGDLDVA